jgi:hypothetical protein
MRSRIGLGETAWMIVLFLESVTGRAGRSFRFPPKAVPWREQLFRMLVVASLITSLLCRLAGRVVSTVRNIAKLRQESRRAGLAAAGERCNRRISKLSGNHARQKVRQNWA